VLEWARPCREDMDVPDIPDSYTDIGSRQGLTLVHSSASPEHFLWDDLRVFSAILVQFPASPEHFVWDELELRVFSEMTPPLRVSQADLRLR